MRGIRTSTHWLESGFGLALRLEAGLGGNLVKNLSEILDIIFFLVIQSTHKLDKKI